MARLGTLCGAAFFLVATSANAQAIRVNSGFLANNLGPTDDGSTWHVPLGFEVTYFGANFTEVYVNNNGWVSFDYEVSTLFTATKLDQRLLAVFFADVDTRADAGTGTLHWGTDTVDGRPAFAATWPAVGDYEHHVDKPNTFQVVLINRADTGAGHFDVEFNYDSIEWESGDRSDGSVDGIGGWPSAIVGYSDGVDASFFPGSGIPGTFLDSDPVTGLIHGPTDGGVLGRYVFEFREDTVAHAAPPSDGGAPDAAVDATVPGNAGSPGALGCACELATAQMNSRDPKLTLLTFAAIALVLRRLSPSRR